MQQIERWRPDFIIPAETKGARLLDAALAYARDELGKPISIPVLYGAALAYIDPEILRDSRVLIVDDAVCTGANLDRHRSWIATYGVAEIHALVCVGLNENGSKRHGIDCFVDADRSLYERCVWQLTELVVARGLPPEVDHFVFEAQVPGRFASAWRELEAVLAAYGELTIDGPVSKHDQAMPMTLHFPQLPARPGHSPMPPYRHGPHKLRFFPQPGQGRFLVLPISLPALVLPPDADPDQPLASEWARQLVQGSVGGDDSAADLLIDEAKLLHPKTVFGALSSATELQLARGFAEVLGGTFAGASLVSQQEPFDRFYGPESGERIAAAVHRELGDALARGEHAGGLPTPSNPAKRRFLDAEVADMTLAIATHLKAMYDNEEDLTERRGLSMPEIAAALGTNDLLLVSRCISFGLAMTTLVPYIEAKRRADGSIQVERFYRVSENNRGPSQTYTDIDHVHRRKSEQALALICHRLRTACVHFADSPVPEEVLTPLVGVLNPLVLADNDIALCTRPGAGEEVELLLLDGVPPVPFESSSTYYEETGNGIAPTAEFRRLYESRQLDIDLDGSVEAIETHVDLLGDFMDGIDRDELKRLVSCWAMSSDRRLGMKHVQRSLRAALEELRRPLRLILRGQEHAQSAKAAVQSHKYALAAACKLQRLSSDWSAPALDHWQKPGRREQRLLASLGAPSGGSRAIYALPTALTTLIAALAEVVENLDKASVRHWIDGDEITSVGEAARKCAVGAAINWCAVVRHRLTSLYGEGSPLPVPEQPTNAIAAAAGLLLDTVDLLDAFVAAIAGEFRGEIGESRPAGTADQKRHVSILSLDIAGGTAFGQLHDAETTHLWKEEALDIAAQWTRAFGSWPIGKRLGDEIKVEFDQAGDVAVLCAAAVQQHIAALRSVGGEDVRWRFHCGVDCGQVQEGPDNLTGPCLDRASKLAKLCDARGETDHVFATREMRDRCSPELREEFAHPHDEVRLDSSEGDSMAIHPFSVDSAVTVQFWCERLQELGDRIARTTLRDAGEAPLWFGPDESDEAGGSESASG